MPPRWPLILPFWCCCLHLLMSWRPDCRMADAAPTTTTTTTTTSTSTSTTTFTFLWSSADHDHTADASSKLRTRLRVEMADELLLMAIGRHASFGDALTRGSPANDDAAADDDDAEYAARDQRQHLQAATALHLLQRLRTMEAMDEALTAAADETAASVAEYATAVQIFYELAQRKVEYDGALWTAYAEAGAQVRQWYRRLPATRSRFAARRTLEVRTLLEKLGRETAFVKKLAICSLFLDTARAWSGQQQQQQQQPQQQQQQQPHEQPQQSGQEQHQQLRKQQHAKLAMDVLKLAKNDKKVAERVEGVFKMAVEETAEEMADVWDEQKMRETLFLKLVDQIRQDAILNAELVRDEIH